MQRFSGDLSIVLGGAAGQGIQTVEALLMQVLRREGYHVFACKEYMSRIRGGSNSTEIRVTSRKRAAFVRRIDLLFALDQGVIPHLAERITEATVLLGEKERLKDGARRMIDVPFTRFAGELGSPLYTSTVAVGVVLGMLGVEPGVFEAYLREHFSRKGDEVVAKNIEAARKGFAYGKHIAFQEGIEIAIAKHEPDPDEIMLDGTQSIGLGALAGGCDFISSYPMSPGTGPFAFLAQNGAPFGVVVDQAEDEVGAINMSLGASYAGARALVSTSGGGFALMEEGVSLSGMTETPIVVHLGMRPGPATGLPTRTEQADLNLVLYAGHGEFPRAVFAPGTPQEGAAAMRQAFEIADRYQIPVFVLTDQYFLDSVFVLAQAALRFPPLRPHIVETASDYLRYLVTEDGVSPRGVPGYGAGLVCVDSDEHTEDGHITESGAVRVAMHEKRLHKLDGVRAAALLPTVIGDLKSAETLVVAWGSNRGVLEEALESVPDGAVAGLHFHQVYPLPAGGKKLFRGKKVVVLENNATGQFAEVLKREYGLKVSGNILQYDGCPFSVEEVVSALENL